MDKKHLCFRKQPYPEKSAILIPDGHTCGLQAKAIPPSSSLMICRQVLAKMTTCVRSIGHRCAFLPALGACFQHVPNKRCDTLTGITPSRISSMVLRITLPPCGRPRGRLPWVSALLRSRSDRLSPTGYTS